MFSKASQIKTTQLAGLLLIACLVAVPASGREIIKWVDAEGVTHFGHAATAAMNVAAAAKAPVAEPLVERTSEQQKRISESNSTSQPTEASAAAPGAQFSQFVTR
jgi:hypothetical protein